MPARLRRFAVLAAILTLLAGAPGFAGDAGCTPRTGDARPLKAAIEPRLVPFQTSPFPYDGNLPGDDNKPFLDDSENGRRGHTSPRGGVHLAEEAYSDRNSLLYIPKGFVLSPRALIVVFLHGNNVRLMRDVYQRQRIPQQLAASRLNAALVAPQFALDIADSSAGNFWRPGAFRRYLDEAAGQLAALYGDACSREVFARMGVVLVAYSGGYNPAAYALDVGGADARLRGVALFDALYGETDKFARWIRRRGSAFFFSAYSESSRAQNLDLRQAVETAKVPINSADAALRLSAGSVSFLSAGPEAEHQDFMTRAWAPDPLTVVLSAVRRVYREP